jgi:hypothetical protein
LIFSPASEGYIRHESTLHHSVGVFFFATDMEHDERKISPPSFHRPLGRLDSSCLAEISDRYNERRPSRKNISM